MAACGVCHTDLHVIKGEVKFPLPCVLGHEISGVVAEVAADVKVVRSGDAVVCSFIMPVASVITVCAGQDDLCETFFAMNRLKEPSTTGKVACGAPTARRLPCIAWEDWPNTPSSQLLTFPAPANVPLTDACILGCAVMTAYGALKNQAGLQPNESVAVVGTGGVGSNVIQLAKAFGAGQIIAVDIRDDKLATAKDLGATHGVNVAQGDPVAEVLTITGGRGVDVAIEALGRPDTVVNAFMMARDGGRWSSLALPRHDHRRH